MNLFNRTYTVRLGIHDTRIQRQHLCLLLEGSILDQLLRKIEELPDLRAATAAGMMTFADYSHYTTALIAYADPNDTWRSTPTGGTCSWP